jgi:hypothetical protein
LRLLSEVRTAQHRALWTQGVLLGVIVFLVFLVGAAAVGVASPKGGLALLLAGLALGVTVLVLFGVVLPRRRVGDDERTAKTLAAQLPELNLDLLAAVELSKALGRKGEDFSPDLARAFLRDVDVRASRLTVGKLIDQRPTQRTAMALVATVFVMLALLVVKGAHLRAGLAAILTPAQVAEVARRQPITGDIELTYRYPAHTGLEPRTIPGSTGDVSAPAGTEVTLKTRADRDIEGATLIFTPDNTRVPLRIDKRELTGSFVLKESGTYHVAFLDDGEVVMEGPDQSITVEADQPPQARITSPADGLELDPKKQNLTLKFEASDDYGLSALDLVYTPQGGQPQRVSLKPDDGRTTRGSYAWDLSPLKLTPGQIVTYVLEATDNDAVKGPKKGTSAVLRVKVYSSAEHRREALQKAEVLWTRLIDHLADRMESPDRFAAPPTKANEPSTKGVDAVVSGKSIDERGATLATDFAELAHALNDEQDPPQELVSALLNVGGELRSDVSQVKTSRDFLLRLTGRIAGPSGKTSFVDSSNKSYTNDLLRRVSAAIGTDIQHSEKNVLYLEALLDRVRIDAIRELAQQLREDRKELTRLLDEFNRSKDPATQQQLLDQMQSLKQRMLELQQRMMELGKQIHDDFMNADALQQMEEELGLGSSLEEIEKLIREGKSEEALKKMQELSMEMDDFLQSLDDASDKADQQADPELAKQFTEFQETLDEAIQKQEQLSDKTRQLRDKYRQQQAERIAKQGEALKKDLKERLDELEKSWQQFDGKRLGSRFEETQREAAQARNNVEQSLEANDFDLASEAADEMEAKARQMADQAQEQRLLEEQFGNPPESRRESRQAADKLSRDAKKAEEVAQKLRDLFPQPGQQMSEQDRQQMAEMSRQQKQLQQQSQQLQQQMDSINERAPIFDDEAQQQMQQAGQRMQGAGEKLQGKDASRGYGEQQGALQQLQAVQKGLEQSGNQKGKKGGIPLPIRRQGMGRGNKAEKVEIPEEDPNAAPREFRKDVMDAMKQGAPDRYKDQNKKYYEELVK